MNDTPKWQQLTGAEVGTDTGAGQELRRQGGRHS
jgi:hypothetical protein